MATKDPASPDSEPKFEPKRHVKYHMMCLKTLLPTLYTSNDSNRMLLAFLTLNALDLLGALDTSIDAAERQGYIEWVYRCQLEDGGFRGFTGADPGPEQQRPEAMVWDPANIAGTFFALEILILLGDRLERVKRPEALRWMRRLQWPDGSFGDILDPEGRPSGGQDIRFCYMAAGIRYLLRGEDVAADGEDIDADALANFVLGSQAYDGGFGRRPLYEGNAGWTYCAVGCLKLLSRLPTHTSQESGAPSQGKNDTMSVDRLLHWLASRQVPCPEAGEPDSEETEETAKSDADPADESPFLHVNAADIRCAGLNGRSHKPADTCYSFWAVAALEMLGHTRFINKEPNRRFLLERTQHRVGGFGKTEGDPPDILHASLGLAALSFMQEPGIKTLDPVLCLTADARKRAEEIRRGW